MLDLESILDKIINVLPDLKDSHHRNGSVYKIFDELSQECVTNLFGENGTQKAVLSNIGLLRMPFVSMGEIKSTHLFGLDELIIFSFYLKNRNIYKKVFDIGANIGLHSIILSKAGFNVVSYEPDPWHFKLLTENLRLNEALDRVELRNKAVSKSSGEIDFIRVLGNTTGSHLAGAKNNPYGKLEKFKVQVDTFKAIMKDADLLKIDVEGHESEILLSTDRNDWVSTDAIVEIGTSENSKLVFEHMNKIGVNMFSQKKSWKRVENVDEVPNGYKEGSLFISLKDVMPW